MSRRPHDKRVAVALLLALGALVAAGLAAVGPAVPERAVYAWPPAHLPEAKPTRTWFAPLLVARQDVRVLRRHRPLWRAPRNAARRGPSGRAPGDGARPRIEPRTRGHMVTGDRQHQRAYRTYRRGRGAGRRCSVVPARCPSRRQLLVGSPARRDEPSRDTRVSAADLRARHRARPRLEAARSR